MCHLLRVTCHMSLMQTATAMDHPPANSLTMHSRRQQGSTRYLVCLDHFWANIAHSETNVLS